MGIVKKTLTAAVLAMSLVAAGCGQRTASDLDIKKAASEREDGHNSQVASGKETVGQSELIKEDMAPLYGNEVKDGIYPLKVDSSSSMFKITEGELRVKEGKMTAVMTMSGRGYLKLFMGTGKEAVNASETDYIPYVETEEGVHTFEVPVEALDMEIQCSAFSKNKEKWYDRILVFRSDSLPMDGFADGKTATVESLKLKDGNYTVEAALEGGSGRAFIESPAALRVENGKAYATIIWGSSNYDYMKVNDEKILWTGTEGNSTFEIPVDGFDWKLPVIADTIAMSQPHEIEYTLSFDSSTLKKAE